MLRRAVHTQAEEGLVTENDGEHSDNDDVTYVTMNLGKKSKWIQKCCC